MSERRLVVVAMICVAISTGPFVWLILDALAPAHFNLALAAIFVAIFALIGIVFALAWRYGRLTDGVVPSQGAKAKIIGAIAVGCLALYVFSLLSSGVLDARLSFIFSLALGAVFGAASVWAYAWLMVKGASPAAGPAALMAFIVWLPLVSALTAAVRSGSLWTFVMPFLAGVFAAALATWITLRRSANDGGPLTQ
jgi:hypothetical protein